MDKVMEDDQVTVSTWSGSGDLDDIDFTFDYEPSKLTFDGSGYTVSFGPITSVNPPSQKDLFTHYIESCWFHDSHLSDEDPQWQIDSYISGKEYLKDLQAQGKSHYAVTSDSNIDYHFIGTPQEFLVWKMTWSEHLDKGMI